MKKLLTLLALGLSLAVGSAHAADEKAPATQQNRMKTCNAEAKGKKGDEHKQFMKDCLSGKPAAAAKAAPATAATPASPAAEAKPAGQNHKMKTCAAEGKGKKGEEHKQFMKECLSK